MAEVLYRQAEDGTRFAICTSRLVPAADHDAEVHDDAFGSRCPGPGRSGEIVRLKMHTFSGDQTIEGATCWWRPDTSPIPPGLGSTGRCFARRARISRGQRPARDRLRSGQLAVRLRDAIIAHSTMAEGPVALLSKVPPVRAVATFGTAEMFESYARTKGEAGNAA